MFNIKGFQPCSLVDYPGNIAATIFLGGCNFRCHYCHNPELVLAPGKIEPIDEEVVIEYLKKRKGMLDGVVITGGEPCLSVGVIDLIKAIKEIGLLVKLDTNGTHPEVLEKALPLVDYVAMDIKSSLERYEEVCGTRVDTDNILKSIQLIRERAIDYEFRTTMVRSYVAEDDIDKICSWLDGSKKYAIQQFKKDGPMINEDVCEEILYSKEELQCFADKCGKHFDIIEVRNI